MKKAIKIFGIILLVIVTLIVITFFVLSHVLKSALGDNWEDFSKIFTMQSGENLPPLENVEQRTIDVKFINKDGMVETRPIRLYLPEQAQQPTPLVYVPHYEMAEDSAELRRYLAKGWAVASPTAFDNAYNGELTDDDLVFNNAALYTLRHMGEFDRPPQATESHRATSGTGVIDDTPYLEEMFSRSLAQTELLMPRKLLLLLERYQGNSELPVHEGVDDTVYGSLAVYRQEIVEELGQWAENHSLFELDTAMREAIANAEESGGYLAAWEEIKSVLE